MRDYEAILAKLAIDHADLELADFEPPTGTTRLREFIDRRWGDSAGRTRKKVRSVLMSFFKWAQAEFKLHGNLVAAFGRRACGTSSASSSRAMRSLGSSARSQSYAIESR